jgi:hypothetical protein
MPSISKLQDAKTIIFELELGKPSLGRYVTDIIAPPKRSLRCLDIVRSFVVDAFHPSGLVDPRFCEAALLAACI